MKRDIELIRLVLLEVERKATIHPRLVNVPGYSQDEIDYHVELLLNAGYLTGTKMSVGVLVRAMTWDGHELLDATRSDTVWQKVKAKLKDHGIEVPITVIQQLATRIGSNMLGLAEGP